MRRLIGDIDAEIAAANLRGDRVIAEEPRAVAARYDVATRLVHVTLSNDCLFAFPARRVQGLENAQDNELGEIEILGLGVGLRWDKLDVDVSVPGLLAGLFGTRAWMGRQRAATAEAARRNGAKGGRPRKAGP